MTVSVILVKPNYGSTRKIEESSESYLTRMERNERSRVREALKRADPIAREALNQYNRDRYSKNKEAARAYGRRKYYAAREKLDALKSKPCVDCNNSFPPECMDFDHLPGQQKLFAIGITKTRSWESIQAEIDKCDLVCANCHRIRTTARKREHRKVDINE